MTARYSFLGELAKFTNGAVFKSSEWGDVGARIIRIQNLTDPGKSFNRTLRQVPKEIMVHPGDLLVSWSATLGVFEWPGPDVAVLNQHIFRVEPNESKVDRLYLRFALARVLDDIERHLHGATMKHVNKGDLLSVKIFTPSLAEQKQIAQLLVSVDALRAKRHEAIALLDDLAQSIFLDIFNTERHSCRRVDLPTAFWFQEGPGIRNWQFAESGVKLLNVGNIEKNGQLNLDKTNRYISTEEAYGRYSHFLVDAGDLVIASSGISIDNDGMLRTRGSFVDSSLLPLCMNTSTIRFKSIPNVSNLRYLQSWLNSIEFREQITRLVTGSAQLNFGPSHLKSLKISLPEIATQREFAEKIGKLESKKSLLHMHLAELDALFASIQHRAFRGELWADIPAA